MQQIIHEGMREGDLVDLVLPLISVDEFESKVDAKKAIVFGFYVHDQDAADDLNRFLQKSAVPLLDTDISPAPDQHGYFMVFVEMMNDERIAANMADILAEIKSLVGVEEWEMRARGVEHLIPFNERNLEKALDREKEHEVVEFLQPSALANVLIEDGVLVCEGSGERFVFDLVALERIDELMSRHQLAGMRLDMRTVAKCSRLTRMLGESWNASMFDKFLLLHRNNDPRGLLLRL